MWKTKLLAGSEHENVRYGCIVCACVHWIHLAWDRDILNVLVNVPVM